MVLEYILYTLLATLLQLSLNEYVRLYGIAFQHQLRDFRCFTCKQIGNGTNPYVAAAPNHI